MEFSTPAVFWSLFLLGIPILIHLFQFKKRKKVYFSNLALLQKVKQEHSNRQRLKHLLILASRLLALLALIFAFAQPYIPVNQTTTEQQSVVIYLDNSFSLESVGENGNLLDANKQYALRILQAHDQNQQFYIVTNDFTGKYTNTYNKTQAEELVQAIEPSSNSRNTNDILLKINSLTKNPSTIYWLSDFQSINFPEASNNVINTPNRIIAIPQQALKTDNLVIDSVYFISPVRALNGNDKLVVITKNTGPSAYENAKLELALNNQVASFKNVQIDAFSSRYDTLNFSSPKSEFIQGELTITDENYPFDNKHYFSYTLPKQIKVAHIYGEPYTKAIKNLFETDSIFQLTEILETQVNANSLNNYNLIILNNLQQINSGFTSAIHTAAKQGISLFISGGPKTSIQQYNELLTALEIPTFLKFDTSKTNILKANFKATLFQGVFEKTPKNPILPTLFGYYTKSNNSTYNGIVESIFETATGESVLNAYYTNATAIYTAAFGLNKNESSFTKNSLFVPILLNAAFQSLQSGSPYYTLGNNEFIQLNQSVVPAESYTLTSISNPDYTIIPRIQTTNSAKVLNPMGSLKKAGFYSVQANGKTVGIAALNYNKSEFDLQYLNSTDVINWFQLAGVSSVEIFNQSIDAIQNTVQEAKNGIQLWRYFILATLIFLLVEVLLSRFLKD